MAYNSEIVTDVHDKIHDYEILCRAKSEGMLLCMVVLVQRNGFSTNKRFYH